MPRQIVSDNLKSGITKACFYEPNVNRTYADLAAHYGTAVVPARPYKPRDKAKVEVNVQVAQRWMNFAIANPARQVFFTVVTREEKYKAKNLIDVVIYRGSDALYGWMFDILQGLGLKLGAIALCALPVTVGWLVLSAALGRTQERRAERLAEVAAQGRLN